MTRYLVLLNFTDQGIRAVDKTTERATAFQASVEAAGGKVLHLFWSIGAYDGCVVFEAPDDATATTLLLQLGRQGNVRTQSLRVFNETELDAVLQKL